MHPGKSVIIEIAIVLHYIHPMAKMRITTTTTTTSRFGGRMVAR